MRQGRQLPQMAVVAFAGPCQAKKNAKSAAWRTATQSKGVCNARARSAKHVALGCTCATPMWGPRDLCSTESNPVLQPELAPVSGPIV